MKWRERERVDRDREKKVDRVQDSRVHHLHELMGKITSLSYKHCYNISERCVNMINVPERKRERKEGNVDFTSNGMCTAETCNFQECVAVEKKTDYPSTRSI